MGGSRVTSLWSSCPSVSAHLSVTSQADASSDVGSVPTPQEGPPSLDCSSTQHWGCRRLGPWPVCGAALVHRCWGLFVGPFHVRMRVYVHICSHRGPSRARREGRKCGVSLRPRDPGQSSSLWDHSKEGPRMAGEDGPVQKSRHGTCCLRHTCGSCVHTVASAHICPHPCPVSVLTGIGRIPPPRRPSYFGDPAGTRGHSCYPQSPSPQAPAQGGLCPGGPVAEASGGRGSSRRWGCPQTPFSKTVVVQRPPHPWMVRGPDGDGNRRKPLSGPSIPWETVSRRQPTRQ